MGKPTRRRVLASAGVLTCASIAGCLGDDDDNGDDDTEGSGNGSTDGDEFPEPDSQITMVIPFSQGGGFDWYARQVATFMGDHLANEPDVVPENVGGAGGMTGTNQVWGAEPDGYTIQIRHGLSSVWSQIAFSDDAAYDVREMTDLGMIDMITYGILRADHVDPIDSWDELADTATELRWGTDGIGGTGHLFPSVLGITSEGWDPDDLDFVHMDGIGEYTQAMDAGDVDIAVGAIPSAVPYFEDDISSPVVTFTEDDEDGWEDIPNLFDWDVPNAEEPVGSFRTPRVFSAPPELPDDRLAVLEEAIADVYNDEAFQETAEEDERPIQYHDAEETSQITEDVLNTWQQQEDLLMEVLEE